MTLLKRITLLFCLLPIGLSAQNDVYLFYYFTQNGQDGLHFAYSYDGLKWDSLNKGQSFLTPSVGKDKLMRDSCIVQADYRQLLGRRTNSSGYW
jgi:hypothetical protein